MASGAAYFLSSQVNDFYLLTALHLLLGFGTAAGFGPLISDISHWFLRHRGIAVALIASGNYLAGGLWPLFLSDILLEQGWREAYQMLAVLTLIVIILKGSELLGVWMVQFAACSICYTCVGGCVYDAPPIHIILTYMHGSVIMWVLAQACFVLTGTLQPASCRGVVGAVDKPA